MLSVILVCVLAVVILVKQWSRPANYPPGPRGLPLVGYLPFLSKLDRHSHLAIEKLARKYGRVVGLYMGPQALVVVTGYDAVRAVFQNDDMNGRPNASMAFMEGDVKRENRRGLMFWDGDKWKEQRRFALRHLRELGFGRTSIEGMMQEELRDLVEDIRLILSKSSDNALTITELFSVSTLNILWAMVAGYRYKRDDARLRDLLKKIEILFRGGNPVVDLIMAGPLGKLRRLIFGPTLNEVTGKELKAYLQDEIKRHKLQASEEPRDYIDVYLKELEKNPDKSLGYSEAQLLASIVDMFSAGGEITSNSIAYTILYFILHPEIQERVHNELQTVCPNRLPEFGDRPNLPYTEATLMEVLRITSIAPVTVAHESTKDTTLMGYNIPKGTLIVPSLYSIHWDQTYWRDPHVFRPERHLDSQGKLLKSERIMPFGQGKRSCMGEALAKNTMFLFVTTLIHHFHFKLPQGENPNPSTEPLPGLTLSPQPFKAVLVPRNL